MEYRKINRGQLNTILVINIFLMCLCNNLPKNLLDYSYTKSYATTPFKYLYYITIYLMILYYTIFIILYFLILYYIFVNIKILPSFSELFWS